MEEIKTVEETEKRKKGVGEHLDEWQRCLDVNIHARLSAFMHAVRVQIRTCVHTCIYVS